MFAAEDELRLELELEPPFSFDGVVAVVAGVPGASGGGGHTKDSTAASTIADETVTGSRPGDLEATNGPISTSLGKKAVP